MTAEALRGWCGLAVAAGLLATGCTWEVQPAASSEGALDQASDAGFILPDSGGRAVQLSRQEMDCD